MPQVPQYHREVAPQLTPTPYLDPKLNYDMFGVNVAQAMGNVGNGMNEFSVAMQKIKDRVDDTKILEMMNKSSEWEQKNLHDKENGYLYKFGKDAYGGSEALLKDYDDYMKDYIKNARFTTDAARRAQLTYNKARERIAEQVTSHDFKEGIAWSNSEAQQSQINFLNNAVNLRNNPDEIQKSLQSGYQAIEWQGELQHLDRSAIELNKMQYRSNVHEAVLNAYLADGSLKASQYLEEHKGEISPNKLPHYIDAVKNNELKYNSIAVAQKIIAKANNEQEALQEAEQIKDVEMSDAVISRVRKFYNQQDYIEDLQKRDMLKGFYDTAITKIQNDEPLSYDDIPDGLDSETKLSLMNYVNKNGQPETDNQTWEDLYNMSINNAQGFAEVDLNRYRGFLSDGEYKEFVKKQQDIKNGKFYTNIKDDDEMIKEALKAIGLKSDGKQKSAFSEIRAMTRELEARKGRAITDEELLNITNSLGYKGQDGVQLYKRLEQGMAKRTGFIKDVMNDFTYYQSQHNGQMPSDEEKYKIILKRASQEQQKQKSEAETIIDRYSNTSSLMRNISSVTAKPNEQKVLTYFADTQVPQISNELGFKLTVTSRYRKPNGKYASHHSEGRAADISMSELSAKNRIRAYEKILQLPNVYKVGTSDAAILAHFSGNNKIVDERDFDKKHGTNHVNHAHITLINYNPQTKTETIAQNNVYRF